jgi:hypothetical protein
VRFLQLHVVVTMMVGYSPLIGASDGTKAVILESADLGIDGLEKSDSRVGLRPPITETRDKISLVAILGENRSPMLVID